MIYCITGPMAAGKNYICKIYEKRGFICIDLDKLTHNIIEKARNEILESFKTIAEKLGINLLKEDGTINRKALGKLVFSDARLLKQHESIIYSYIIEDVKKIIEENSNMPIIINATVLYKTPELLQMCSKILYVNAPSFIRLIRAKKRDKMPIFQILRRFWVQKNLLKEYKKFNIPLTIFNNYKGCFIGKETKEQLSLFD